MSQILINQYLNDLERYKKFSGGLVGKRFKKGCQLLLPPVRGHWRYT
jgi:hypothetical protein